MKYRIIASTLAVMAFVASGFVQAGTAGITGLYSGSHSLLLYNAASPPPGSLFGNSIADPNNAWSFDFDAGTFFIAPGTLSTGFAYLPAGAFALVDNADGTYTGTYDFSFGPSTVATTTTTWDITLAGGEITLTTLDTEGDGIPGTTFTNNFGLVSPEINGTAGQLADISVDTMSLDFGLVITGDMPAMTVTVTNSGVTDLNIGNVAAVDTPVAPYTIVTDTCSNSVVAAAATCDVTVQFQPLSVATFNDSFDIPSDDLDTPVVSITLTGRGVPATQEITVSSTAIDFGSVGLGTAGSETVTVTNDGGSVLTVSGVDISGIDLLEFSQTNDCTSVAPGGSCTISVSFTPATSTIKSAILTITSDDSDEASVDVSLAGTGTDLVTSITGTFSGEYLLTLYNAAAGQVLGLGVTAFPWSFDFDAGVFSLGDGLLTTGLPYSTGGALTFVDNLDGTYTGTYDLSIATAADGGGTGTTTIKWKIVQEGGGVTITTIDADSDGVPGTTIAGVLSLPVGVTMDGTAVLADADSDGDGIPDVSEMLLGLNPNSTDSDGDGISDAVEVGGDINNPLDSDGDGLIDALELGTFASFAWIAHRLAFSNGENVTITTDSGEVLTGVSSGEALATDELPQIVFPFGTISYTTSSPVGGSVTVRLEFSSDLPKKLVLYKVNDADTYTLLPTSVWTQVDERTVEITLTDGDPRTDLDGLANGVIVDPVAVGNDVVGGFDFTSSSSGCSMNPGNGDYRRAGDWLLVLLFLAWMTRSFLKKKNHCTAC